MDVFHSQILNLKTSQNAHEVVSLLKGIILYICDIKERLKFEEYRFEISKEFFDDLSVVVTSLQAHKLYENKILTEVFRCLRNACAGSLANQKHIHENTDICQTTKFIVEELLASKPTTLTCTVTLRCIVQFLGNYTSGNAVNQSQVWNLFMSAFRDLLRSGDDTLLSYTCMLVHNIFSGSLVSPTTSTCWYLEQMKSEFVGVCQSVVTFATEKGDEWGIYATEDILQIPGSLKAIHNGLCNQERLFILELLLDWLERTPEKEYRSPDGKKPASENLVFIAEQWELNAYKILTLTQKATDDCQSPLVIVKQLSVLCEATAHGNLYPELRENTELVSVTLHLLSGIHQIGKEGCNYFTNIEKISEAGNVDRTHSTFGLKKDLIRFLANSCHRNKLIQDKIREMEGIPLILDQTNVDARNPYITQWAVLAIHNLCEGNNENKAVLAGLKQQGLAGNVGALEDFGVQAEMKDDKIVVKQTKIE
ncbi:hypothetical protein ScPMuIL_008709 [Solemya velum]